MLLPRAWRLFPPHARGRGHLARARARARGDRAADNRRRGGDLRQHAPRGCPGGAVTFGKPRSAAAPGVYTVVYEYAQRDEGVAAGELGLRLLCWLLPEAGRPAGSVPEGWNWPEARDQFIRFAQRRALGPSTASLVRAAETRGIPWLRLNDQTCALPI